jgi:FixJ family two-component response regulator
MSEKVFVVDDDPRVRKGLARLLASEGVTADVFGSAEEFLGAFDPRSEGCILLDLAMPGRDGLALQEELARRGCELPVIFVTGRADVPATVRAMKGGAVDFLTKPAPARDLLAAVGKALERDRARRAARKDQDELTRRLATLTARERDVMEGVVAGLLNKQIAGRLGIAEKTVKTHRGRVMAKMGTGSVAELVRLLERADTSGPATAAPSAGT